MTAQQKSHKTHKNGSNKSQKVLSQETQKGRFWVRQVSHSHKHNRAARPQHRPVTPSHTTDPRWPIGELLLHMALGADVGCLVLSWNH